MTDFTAFVLGFVTLPVLPLMFAYTWNRFPAIMAHDVKRKIRIMGKAFPRA